MESELAIPTSLMSAPKKDIISLATAQLKFMNLFAIPLFKGAADILPAMQYCVDELQQNTDLFGKWLSEQQVRESRGQSIQQSDERTLCPKTIAFTTPPEPATEARPAKGALSPVPKVVEPHSTPGITVLSGLKQSVNGRAVNGIVTSFALAATPDANHNNDPYNTDGWHPPGHTRQRCSETTEGSSARYTGDWASQATSATTGKMPLSPSTQGTSMASKDSLERLNGVPATSTAMSGPTITVLESDEAKSHRPDLKVFDSNGCPQDGEDEVLRNGHHHHHGMMKSHLEPDPVVCRQLKKKPSRFRMNGFQSLFRKHKSPSPAMQATDTAG